MIHVLNSERTPHQNAFIDLFAECMDEDIAIVGFSWRRALFGKYDLMVLHWPELLFRGRGPIKGALKWLLSVLLFLRLWATRVPVVRVAHNQLPHESLHGLQRPLYRAFSEIATETVHLAPSPSRGIVIPHGHYRTRYRRASDSRSDPPTILFFGLVRPYKGIETLIEAFSGFDNGGARLRLVGQPVDEGYVSVLRELSKGVENVDFDFRFIPDFEVPEIFALADLVVLPYRHLTNSGVMILAATLERPVLVPEAPASDYLRSLIGKEWVSTFDASAGLRPSDLSAALQGARDLDRTAVPDLTALDWQVLGATYSELFRQLVARKQSPCNR